MSETNSLNPSQKNKSKLKLQFLKLPRLTVFRRTFWTPNKQALSPKGLRNVFYNNSISERFFGDTIVVEAHVLYQHHASKTQKESVNAWKISHLKKLFFTHCLLQVQLHRANIKHRFQLYKIALSEKRFIWNLSTALLKACELKLWKMICSFFRIFILFVNL